METFVNLASPFVPWLSETDNNVVHPARSLAISLAPAGEARVFRFMFLSLLTFGTASALLLTLLIWAVLSLAVSVRLLDASLVYPFHWAWFFVWLTVAFVVAERGFTFRSITLRVPFSMASIAVLQGALEKAEKVQPRTKLAPPPRLYLAGGFYSGWQDRIAQVWSGSLVDPRAHNLQDENQYTFWDLEAIRTCDWILAHIEASNPGGYALALEVGFAKALGKRVILVDEKSDGDDRLRRHMGMIHACADLTFDDLDEVVGFLESLRFLRFVEEPDEVQRPRE